MKVKNYGNKQKSLFQKKSYKFSATRSLIQKLRYSQTASFLEPKISFAKKNFTCYCSFCNPQILVWKYELKYGIGFYLWLGAVLLVLLPRACRRSLAQPHLHLAWKPECSGSRSGRSGSFWASRIRIRNNLYGSGSESRSALKLLRINN